MNIGSVGALNSLVNNFDAQKAVETKENSGSFSKVLGDAINKVNELQVTADNKAESLIRVTMLICMMLCYQCKRHKYQCNYL